MLRAAFSFAAAIAVVAVVALATRTPEGGSTGGPFVWSSPAPSCTQPNPFNGCGTVYDVAVVGLDYVFWGIVVFAFTLLVDALRGHAAKVRDG